MNQVSFQERVKNEAILNSRLFNENFIECEYCILSKAFKDKGYYIIRALGGNYLHLVGVNTAMPADSFFKKCLNGTLTENDFNFTKAGVGRNALKGTVREKIRVLPNMVSLFDGKALSVQVPFKKNQISCALASSDGLCTLGFSESGHPKTLLQRDHLDTLSKYDVDAIIRRYNDKSTKFDTLIYYNKTEISYVDDSFYSLLSESIINELQ